MTYAICGLASSVTGFIGSITAGNQQFEKFEASFATLMGSADQAKQHIAGLLSANSTDIQH